MALTVSRQWFENEELPLARKWLIENGAERSIEGRLLLALVDTCAEYYYTRKTVFDTPDNA